MDPNAKVRLSTAPANLSLPLPGANLSPHRQSSSSLGYVSYLQAQPGHKQCSIAVSRWYLGQSETQGSNTADYS